MKKRSSNKRVQKVGSKLNLGVKKKSQKVQDVEIDYSKKLKRFDESWDFKGVNTKEYTHCFHV